jgi:predicted kinase
VVADAVFDDPDHRNAIEKTALHRNNRFDGFWLDADPALLWKRIDRRQAGPSDAKVDVLEMQLARRIGNVGWRRIDSSRSVNDIYEEMVSDLAPERAATVRA